MQHFRQNLLVTIYGGILMKDIILNNEIYDANLNTFVSRAFVYKKGTNNVLVIYTDDFTLNIITKAIKEWGNDIDIECETEEYIREEGIEMEDALND